MYMREISQFPYTYIACDICIECVSPYIFNRLKKMYGDLKDIPIKKSHFDTPLYIDIDLEDKEYSLFIFR